MHGQIWFKCFKFEKNNHFNLQESQRQISFFLDGVQIKKNVFIPFLSRLPLVELLFMDVVFIKFEYVYL